MPHGVVRESETVTLTGLGDSSLGAKPDPKHSESVQEAGIMLDLLCAVGKKVGSVSRQDHLIRQATQMTQHTLKAMASSVLLLDDKGQKLIFEVAEGEVGKTLRKIKISAPSGIAGWVVRHGKPIIVNDVTKDRHFNTSIDENTGFITKSIICAPLVVQRRIIGVIEVLNKLDGSNFSENDLETLVSVASTVAVSIENAKLHQHLLNSYRSTIRALAAAIEAKDPYTCGHSQRVMEYAMLGGASLSFLGDEVEVLEYAGVLHDVGKIGIADSILTKPAALAPAEWAIMREHSQIGASILDGIPFLEKAQELILHHHERYDGKGYPDGLKGEEIPIGARLLAVADAFDTMTTDRSYRSALSVDYAVDELYRCSSTQFCPVAAEAFIAGFKSHELCNSDKVASYTLLSPQGYNKS